MILKTLWLLVGLIYLYCIFYKKSINEKFGNNHGKIKKQILYGLKVIDKLFNKHNIYYTAAYGTLLGAVRHWGMIPWDDDGDLNVWRQDYNKIMSLEKEFKTYGITIESDTKLIKIYFNDLKYPFIDLFINDIENGKVVRCSKPFDKSCTQIDKINNWWWKWIDYPAEWIEERKRFKFDSIKIWVPKESEKLLKYWYGENCLIECKTPEIDHITENYIKSQNIDCGKLPKVQF